MAARRQDEGKTGSAVHAYLHRKEGDMRNAGGWYSRAGREPATVSLDEEWQSLAEEMLTVQAVDGARAAMDGFMAAFNAGTPRRSDRAGSTSRMCDSIAEP